MLPGSSFPREPGPIVAQRRLYSCSLPAEPPGDFHGLTQLELQYVVGVQSSLTVWEPGKQPLPAKPRGKTGRPPRWVQRSADHQPVSVKQLAMSLPSCAFREITGREGMERKLRSRFAAVRVRPAHRDYEKAEPHAEEWLLIEWPRSDGEPTKYWISTLPSNTALQALVKMAKHRWIIERDYQELKQELGLGTLKTATGAGSTITPRCASQLWVPGGGGKTVPLE